MEQYITYFGQQAKIACDEKCNKAWGVNNRPYEQLGEDDIVWLSDSELGEAPKDPGTYEGEEGKPTDKSQIPNKWCVRECERCVMSEPGRFNEPLNLTDFSQRCVKY